MSVQLRPLDEPAAQAVIAGGCPPGRSCAPDYPADGDRIAARLLLERLAAGVDPRPFGGFLVCLEPDDLVIGGIGFHGGLDASGRVEIGYGIVPSQQGRGHATQALGLLIATARLLGAKVLLAETESGNLASQAVLGHQNFVRLGNAGETFRFELVLS